MPITAPLSAERTASNLFEVLWRSLTEVIGTAATATLLRRAAQRATARGAGVDGLMFERQGFEFAYVLPQTWKEGDPRATDALRVVVSELLPLLRELTGPVLVRRLEANGELQSARLFAPIEAP